MLVFFFTFYKYQPNNTFNCFLFWLMRGRKMIERTEKKMQNPGLLSKRFKKVDFAYILEQIKIISLVIDGVIHFNESPMFKVQIMQKSSCKYFLKGRNCLHCASPKMYFSYCAWFFFNTRNAITLKICNICSVTLMQQL